MRKRIASFGQSLSSWEVNGAEDERKAGSTLSTFPSPSPSIDAFLHEKSVGFISYHYAPSKRRLLDASSGKKMPFFRWIWLSLRSVCFFIDWICVSWALFLSEFWQGFGFWRKFPFFWLIFVEFAFLCVFFFPCEFRQGFGFWRRFLLFLICPWLNLLLWSAEFFPE